MKERNIFNRISSLLGLKTNETVGFKRSINELSKDAYFETLTEVDRRHIGEFTKWLGELSLCFAQGDDIAIHAVGSSVMPIEKRHAPVRDIDLRILNSEKSNTEEREKFVTFLVDSIGSHLRVAGSKSENLEYTCTTRWVKGLVYDKVLKMEKEEIMPYLDWYNNDPSFEVTFKDGGKPLHISISGLNNYDLDHYLKAEAKNSGYFCSLFNSRNTSHPVDMSKSK